MNDQNREQILIPSSMVNNNMLHDGMVHENKVNQNGNDEISEKIRMAQDIIKCLSDRCEELENLSECIPFIRKEIRSQIDQSIQMIQRSVSERHEQLINELDSSLSIRNESITKLHSDFEMRLQKLTSHVELLKRLTQAVPNSDTPLKANANPVSRDIATQRHKHEIDKLLCAPLPLHPSDSDTMSFFPTNLDQLLSMVRCVGSLGLTGVDAQKTCLSDAYSDQFACIRRSRIDEEVRIDILAQDHLGRVVGNATSKEFSVSLLPRWDCDIEVGIHEKKVTDSVQSLSGMSNGTIDTSSALQVVYKVSAPGSYDLNITLFGEHIKGSPYFVLIETPIKPSLETLANTMKEISALPHRIHGTYKSHRRCNSAPAGPKLIDIPPALADINKMERGDLLYSVGTKGRGDGEFANPSGICVTRENRILVADSNNAIVQVFTLQGQHLFRFGEYGYHPGQLMRPADVAETINGNYLVSDYDLHCVTVFNTNGQYISRFGQRYLSGPKGIIVDSRGRILVVDQKSCMICIFKPTGKFINRFGARGLADNHFGNPVFIAVNSQDEIFVSDHAHHAIKVFDMNGLFLYKFGTNGIEPGTVHGPTGLCFDKIDYLYLSDWGNNRIQVFDQTGNYIRTINSQLEPLNGPQGLVVHQQTNKLFVVDPGNYCFKVYNLTSNEEQST